MFFVNKKIFNFLGADVPGIESLSLWTFLALKGF